MAQETQNKPATGAAPSQPAAQGNAAPKKDKAQKFKKLAEVRTTKALNAIAVLRGLSNKNNYTYTEDQVKKVLSTLRAEVDTLEQVFQGKGPQKTGFLL